MIEVVEAAREVIKYLDLYLASLSSGYRPETDEFLKLYGEALTKLGVVVREYEVKVGRS